MDILAAATSAEWRNSRWYQPWASTKDTGLRTSLRFRKGPTRDTSLTTGTQILLLQVEMASGSITFPSWHHSKHLTKAKPLESSSFKKQQNPVFFTLAVPSALDWLMGHRWVSVASRTWWTRVLNRIWFYVPLSICSLLNYQVHNSLSIFFLYSFLSLFNL